MPHTTCDFKMKHVLACNYISADSGELQQNPHCFALVEAIFRLSSLYGAVRRMDKPVLVNHVALASVFPVLAFQSADRRILLREVGQSALQRRIEGIDAVGIIALRGKDDGLFLVFRKSGHFIVLPFKITGQEPPFCTGTAALYHLSDYARFRALLR